MSVHTDIGETLGTPTILVSQYDPLFLDAFGGIADGIENSDGTTNHNTATDNTFAIKSLLLAARITKRDAVIPPGNWMYKTGNACTINDASNIRLRGSHEDSCLMFVNPLNQQGIILGNGANGINCVQADQSPISLASGTTTASNVLTLATTAGGETATQRLAKGMRIFITDSSQPLPYRAAVFDTDGPSYSSISYYKSTFTLVEEVLSDTQIAVSGVTEWDFNAGAKVGYWPFPNTGVVVENLKFVYDRDYSYQGGASSALQLQACFDYKFFNVSVYNNPSRAFAFGRCFGGSVDTVVGTKTVHGQGSLMTATFCGHGMYRNLKSEDGTHAYDEGGGRFNPSLHNQVDGLRARSLGGGVVGSHQASGHLKISNADIVSQSPNWNVDNDPDTDDEDAGSGITLRGWHTTLTNFTVSRAAIGLRLHKASNQTVRGGKMIECGRAIYDDNTDQNSVRDIEAIDCLFWNVHIDVSSGPNQNHTLIVNKNYSDIRSKGAAPTQGDLLLNLGPQYNMEQSFRDNGWSMASFTRNGGVPVMVGQGSADGKFPLFNVGTSGSIVDQLIGPAYSIAPSTGAISVTVAGTGSVTAGYRGQELLDVPGGTLVVGAFATQLRIETMEIQSLTVTQFGKLHAPTDIITLDTPAGAVAITAATYTVDTVDGTGALLTGHISNKGEYRSSSTSFGQASTTGNGKNIFITGATINNPGRQFVAGEIFTMAGGHPVTIIVDGVPVQQWPSFQALTVGSNGELLTIALLDGGSFVALPPGGGLQLRATDGIGNRASVLIGSNFVSRNLFFENALMVPKTASIAREGRYTVAPTSPVTPTSTRSDGGVGATMTVVYGTIVPIGRSPKPTVLINSNSGSTIAGFGASRSIQVQGTVESACTFVHSATFLLNNGGSNIAMAAGDRFRARSDSNVPVIWTVDVTRADGTPLRNRSIDQSANISYTNGTLLVPTDIRNSLIVVNAADNLSDNYQLPTGTDMSAEFTEIAIGQAVDFAIINGNTNAAATAILTNNTNSAFVTNNKTTVANASTEWRALRTNTSSWSFYRRAG